MSKKAWMISLSRKLFLLKTRDLKESVERNRINSRMHKLSIVLNMARNVYQELDFTAKRENVINFDTIFYLC